jgi:inorganic pyrophosphatase
MNSEPVKYEVDKASGAIFVDRVLTTPMRYPCNYGYIPHTLAGDGDPADVLVIMPMPLIPGSVIRCRAVGMLNMIDEAGEDRRSSPCRSARCSPPTTRCKHVDDLPHLTKDRHPALLRALQGLEKGKWVKLEGWAGADDARAEILASVERYNATPDKPHF